MEIKGIKVVSERIDGLDMKTLRNIADRLKSRLKKGVVVLASVYNGKAFYVASVTKDCTDRIKAGEILKKLTDGRAGGRDDMAQGGTKDTAHVNEALSSVPELLKSML
ncbi:MAG: hypothetical protein D6828_01465 [Nitrospirae bacterium]|nr:MAG: hypothetical protein D6828_01465 [Nitrospirota bacterium]